MRRQLNGKDITTLVFGVIMLALAIGLIATTRSMFGETAPAFTYIQIGASAWYLLVAIFAIAAGAARIKGLYVAVIVFTVLATLIALAAGILAVAATYYGFLEKSGLSIDTVTIEPYYIDTGKSTVLIAINFITFVVMIVLSGLGCASSCCAGPSVPSSNAMTVTTGGGYTTLPPNYVDQPPQHNFQGTSNPNYNPVVVETHKQ